MIKLKSLLKEGKVGSIYNMKKQMEDGIGNGNPGIPPNTRGDGKPRRRGKTADSWKPGAGLAPSPAPPLAGRRISKPRVARLILLEIRHAFVAKRPKCAPFSTQILDKRQVL